MKIICMTLILLSNIALALEGVDSTVKEGRNSIGDPYWTIDPQTNPAAFRTQAFSNYNRYILNPPHFGALQDSLPDNWSKSTYRGKEFFNPPNEPDYAPVPYRNDVAEYANPDDLLDSVPRQLNYLEGILENPLGGNDGPICRAPGVQNYSPIPERLPKVSRPGDEQEGDRLTRFTNDPRTQNLLDRIRSNTGTCNYRAGYNRNSYNNTFNRHCSGRSDQTKSMGQSVGYCYRYVKQAFVDTGLTDHYTDLRGVHAYQAGPSLERAGFENIKGLEPWNITDPGDAPDGAVLVYSGGTSGHIEVKASDDEYISDYISDYPLSESTRITRRLIGIYILEED